MWTVDQQQQQHLAFVRKADSQALPHTYRVRVYILTSSSMICLRVKICNCWALPQILQGQKSFHLAILLSVYLMSTY